MRFTLDGDVFEVTQQTVRASIARHTPECVYQYWVEIDGVRWPVKQVISLATGVTDRQRFQSQQSRRWLEKLGFATGRGASAQASVKLRSAVISARQQPSTPSALEAPDVVLVGCVKSKLAHGAAAKDLYTSAYFSKMRWYAENSGAPWFILSAEHGLVHPDEWLEPYEMYLGRTSSAYRIAWGERVAERLEEVFGSLDGMVFDVHAGNAYVDALKGAFLPRNAKVQNQLVGLRLGERLAWYSQRQEAMPQAETRIEERDCSVEAVDPLRVSEVVARLRDGDSACAPAEVVATGRSALRRPGIYSWWVDEQGAADLTAGLGLPVAPGLIYAGLAGATRSGGAPSKNTLWERIVVMHLGGNHEFSTLRLSLGAILASAYELPGIDEAELTRWMYAHLSVVTVVVADADSLGLLETSVLAALDPPLNLSKVARTAIRRQLTMLRKAYT